MHEQQLYTSRMTMMKKTLVVGVKITLMQPIHTSFGVILLILTANCIYMYANL